MKKTLLEIVKNMLAAIDSEEVDNVGQTEEAGMCVEFANQEYDKMIAKYVHWRHLRRYAQLNTSVYLNEMTCPAGTMSIDPDFVYYDDQKVFFMTPEQFMVNTMARVTSESNIDVINGIKVYTDRNPLYYTTDDNETLRFDAIPSAIDGLTGSLFKVLAYVAPTSALTDDGEYFDLPAPVYPALTGFCRAYAIAKLKGDSSEARFEAREATKSLSAAIITHRLIDKPTDFRDVIIPRRTNRAITTTQTN